MKPKLFFIASLLFCMAAAAQTSSPTTLQGWADRLKKFGTSLQQEQIFIHMDNTCYFLGDTLYYKAYVRTSDGKPSKLSSVLYVELLNQDGYLVKRQLLELENGQGHGSFELLDTLYGGYYELRAYTRWQLNWGGYEHAHVKQSTGNKWFVVDYMEPQYFRDYEKLYSRVFPVYDKPKTPGDFERYMTLRPLRRQFKADGELPKGDVQMYPEGGHLVAGVPCRVAFEANNDEGMHLTGKLTVKDKSGKEVASASTELRGRGSFEFTPEAGNTYKATFVWNTGKAEKALPGVETDGVAMKVTQADGKVKVDAYTAGKASGTALGMTVMNQGIMLDFRELGSGQHLTAELEEANLRTGVCQITLFDEKGEVYADRLAFVKAGDLKDGGLSFSGIPTDPTEAFAPISFTVQGGTPGSTLSMAVRDAQHTEYLYDNGNILTEMLLGSQIRGFVEDPGYFFEVDDEVHHRALDLLLMIQGWRRYVWHDMAVPEAFTLNHMPEKTPLLNGEVKKLQVISRQDEFADSQLKNMETPDSETPRNDENGNSNGQNNKSYSTNDNSANVRDAVESNLEDINSMKYRRGDWAGLKREVVVHASFSKQNAKGVVGDMMTEKGRFSIPSPRFFEGCVLKLAASDSTKWNDTEKQYGHVWLSSGETKEGLINYPEFYVKLNPIYPRFVKPYTWYQCNLAMPPKRSAMAEEWLLDGSRTLAEVTVGASRNRYRKFSSTKPALVLDAYEALNEACDAGLCEGYFIGRDRFATDIARTYIGDMNIYRDYEVELRLNGKLTSYSTALKEERTRTDGVGANAIHINQMPQESDNISSRDIEKFNHLANIDKVYVYTDYSPRNEGDSRYEGADQPVVTVDLHSFPNDGKRETYRDRCYILPGFSVADDFYQPNYSTTPLPEVKDYRRTLYWNPSLKLDDTGRANVTFYNNGKQTLIGVSAEGMDDNGKLQTGKSMPEDR